MSTQNLMSRCFFCKRKVGASRVKGKLNYEVIYARDASLGYNACIDCFNALETSIKKILRRVRY